MNKNNRAAKEPQTAVNTRSDDYEIILRRIMCIFISIEALLISVIYGILFSHHTISYFYRPSSFAVMFLKDCFVLALPMLFAILPMFIRPAYIAIEAVHVLVGAYCLLAAFNSMNAEGLLLFVIFAGRGMLYFILLRRHNKKTLTLTLTHIDREKDERLR